MNTEPKAVDQLERPLTEEEFRVLAEIEAVEKYDKAVEFAGKLATEEAKKTEDNYGGALLVNIPFGD